MAKVGTFNGTGADCNGSDGDSNRVLTLSNTGLTRQSGFLVYASGLALALTTEYTVSHNNSSTQITFLNPLWDDMTIVVRYFENLLGVSGDFVAGPLADFGVTVVRTPVTMTPDFRGDKVYTDGTDENITVVFGNPNKKYELDKSGLTEDYDAIIYIKSDQTLNKYDKITYDSKVYRVQTVSPRLFESNAMFKTVGLFFLSDE